MERAKKEIFSSQIFDGLRGQHPDFMGFIDQKIVPVEGDIVSLFLDSPRRSRGSSSTRTSCGTSSRT